MFCKKTVTLLAVATSVSAICSYPPALNLQSSGNSVSRPDSYNPATIGSPFNIVWDATGWGSTVDIHLLKGPGNLIQYYSTLASGVANTGSFTWTPDCSLESSTTGWGLMIVSEPSCSFQWSMQFGLNRAVEGTCSSSSSSVVGSLTTSTHSVPSSSASSVLTSTWGVNKAVNHTATVTSHKYHSNVHSVQAYPTYSSYVNGYPASHPSYKAPGQGYASVCSSAPKDCTSTSTIWVNPTGTPLTVGNGTANTYKPLYANGASSNYGMGMFAVVAAFAAAFLAC